MRKALQTEEKSDVTSNVRARHSALKSPFPVGRPSARFFSNTYQLERDHSLSVLHMLPQIPRDRRVESPANAANDAARRPSRLVGSDAGLVAVGGKAVVKRQYLTATVPAQQSPAEGLPKSESESGTRWYQRRLTRRADDSCRPRGRSRACGT